MLVLADLYLKTDKVRQVLIEPRLLTNISARHFTSEFVWVFTKPEPDNGQIYVSGDRIDFISTQGVV